MLHEPVIAPLTVDRPLTSESSPEKLLVILPATCPPVMPTDKDPCLRPATVPHSNDVDDTQDVASHPVSFTLSTAVTLDSPKLPPYIVMLLAPDDALFALRTRLVYCMSQVTDCVTLPVLNPDVNARRAVPCRP